MEIIKKCTRCKGEKCITEFYKQNNTVRARCIECMNSLNSIYYKKNRLSILTKQAQYIKDNYDKVREIKRKNQKNNQEGKKQYERNRESIDAIYKFKKRVRSLVSKSFKRGEKKYKKRNHTEHIIGCTIEDFRQYIVSQFKQGMTLENYGKWHIDHITPLATAQSETDIIRLNHYTNLQPLWAEDNLKKGCRIEKVCNDYERKLNSFK